ncbi:thioredoxin-like protein [Crocosphaera subtropica ATCC 51142]|uniref:Thioredoxin-like protein n=1 Tax=Crocosphaera subtropica (strain ATCC 51142 / BH68) TaxID=43989 RepID=B1WNG5_CROS5|nr:thylakoid membrane photosystem I accumulation factor [Crocosphaera subtropica]ACB49807.1 thioredoxin-like protein [Crocosphaera subtropica ATCC 51142]
MRLLNLFRERGTQFSKLLIRLCLISLLSLSLSFGWWGMSPATANIDDDRLDGNIFVVYAGNGSLVPAKLSLKGSLDRKMPTVLVYYLDDSRDCKQFAIVVSRIQEFYGRAANILPISVDSIPVQDAYTKDEPGYYYQDIIPQTVILDGAGNKVFDGKGQVEYEAVDDVLREVFDLLPRSESVELRRRTVNEFNDELVDS